MPEFKANYMKRSLPAAVRFAASAGVLQTLEGRVRYASGDALMTGVAGEHWPIRRLEFEASYEPCDAQTVGVDGHYRKRAIPVFAQQLEQACTIPLDGERGTLKGKPGDWLLRDASGRTWVVANEVFRISYAALGARQV
jgi:hypothetical protein